MLGEKEIKILLERKVKLEKLRTHYTPHNKQKLILQAIKDGYKKIFVRAGRQSGKALALDTPILTPEGFKCMGDIQVGDRVFSELGVETLVTFASEIFTDHDCYEVGFSNGEKIIADAGHRWRVSTKLDRKHGRDVTKVLTTEEMSRSVTYSGESNYKIAGSSPVQMPEKDLPLDPYLLGLWLGDGDSYSARISTAKDIPDEYLFASFSQRLSLVQGLMDSDGWVSKSGKIEFYNTNKNIADKFRILLSSLGIISKVRSKPPSSLNGKHKRCYVVSFATKLPVCRLDQKRKRLLQGGEGPMGVFVTSIKKIKSVPTKCISVDSPSHLFLAGESMIPTHNTQECCDISWVVAGLNPNSVCSIITPSLKQARRIYWKKGTLQNFGPREWVSKVANDDLTLILKNGSYIEVDGSDNIDAHRGDKKDLVVLDEYKDIDPRFYSEVIEPMFATTQGIVIIIGTPPETPESHFRDLEEFAMRDPTWATIHWTSYDSPYTSKEWLDSKRAEMSERGEDDVFKREYLAEYTKGGKNSVFPMFSRSLHVKPVPVIQKYFHSVRDRLELAWINDPAGSSVFAALLVAYHREKGQLLWLDEVYEKDKSKMHTSSILEVVKKKVSPFEPNINRWPAVYDDAEAWFANELKALADIPAFPARKAQKTKDEGISLMKSLMLKKNSWVVSEACENFIMETENYIMVDGKYPKIRDHCLDCSRYGLNFLNVILSLSENSELIDDTEEFYDYVLERYFSETDLGGYIQ